MSDRQPFPSYWQPRAYHRDYYAAAERGFRARGLSVAGEYYGSENRPERGPGVLDMRGDSMRDGRDAAMYRGRGPRGYQRSDERILDDVCERLTDDPWLDATNIDVVVQGAEVQLSGSVQRRADKRRAEVLAERVAGVRDVQNAIRIARE